MRDGDKVHPWSQFTSGEVCRIAHVTPRQLQWWDEREVVAAARRGRRRSYGSEEVVAILVMTELRRKGFSLQKIRRVLRFFQREVGRSAREILNGQSE